MKKNKLAAIGIVAAVLGLGTNEPALSRESQKTYSINSQYEGAVCVYLAPWSGNLNIELQWANFHARQNLNNAPGALYALSAQVKGSLDRTLIVKTNQSLTLRFEADKCEHLPNVSTKIIYLNWQNKPGKN